jgi:hypothetical protein
LNESLHLTHIECLVQEGLNKRLVNAVGLKRELLNVDDSPLADNIFVDTFNFSTLDTFKGSNDSQDSETFIFGFREKLRVLGVSDVIMCHLFTVYLRGEA